MAAITMVILLYIIAQDVERYKKLIDGMSLAALINGLLTIYMAYKVNFGAYNNNSKQFQAIVEGILLLLVSISVYFLNKRK